MVRLGVIGCVAFMSLAFLPMSASLPYFALVNFFAGVGIGVVPESAARRNLQAMKLAQIELTDEWKWRERRVLVREGDTLPGYAQDLIEMLCRHFDHPPGLREKPQTDQRKP